MIPTNDFLIDFMDFDAEMNRDESLWKAYRPTDVREADGDILIAVPFQKQKHTANMEADMEVPREEYKLVLRMYEPKVLRLFIGFGDYEMRDDTGMLQFSDKVKRVPLSVAFDNGQWRVTDPEGTLRAVVNTQEAPLDRWSSLQPDPQETLDMWLYPDGQREVRLAAFDHFSPPRYDALPLGFCKAEGKKERATMAFECKHDECFAGTGERFAKMDLSGQTFYLKNQDGQGVNNRRTYKNIPK